MKKKILILMLFVLPLALFAGVNLKNGNFYITYADIVVPGGGHDLEIVRTYNSKSPEVGWFGFGWGSDYETYLTVSADGSVIVHENGSGATTRFTPKKPVNPKSAAQRIISAIRKKKALTGSAEETLRKRLISDSELRQAYAKKLGVKAKIANGSVLYSNTRGIQRVKKTKSGFVRIYNDGKVETFNKNGKLIAIKDKNNYKVNLKYKSGNLVSIKDSQAKQLFFEWYSDRKVKSIKSAGDKKTFYKYDGRDLVESKDIAGNVFKYAYDSNHNLTKISYTDKTSMRISYNPKTHFVTKVISRNGNETEYKYGEDKKNPQYHYWTEVIKKIGSRKPVKNRYEYVIKTRKDGSQYTYRIITNIDGVKTDTTYTECCSLPKRIKQGSHVTTFEYNKKGLLTRKKSSRGQDIKLQYHKKHNKITKVTTNGKQWTKFEYGNKGNLKKAVNSGGKSVLLFYDSRGRIQKMYDQDKKSKKTRKLSFKYNSLGKPVEIAMEKVGKINIAYDNYGEIKKVESKAGHRMALQVTRAFQSLLEIVKPAGVNLSM